MKRSLRARSRLSVEALVIGATMVWSSRADAFCGFYVSGADAKMWNDATQVALMRDGTRTVLSMQNDYKGPPEDFALVIPVPVVLQKENVKTLAKDVFERLDTLTAPRLVEYWEQDPCMDRLGTIGHGAGTGTGQGFGSGFGRLGGEIFGMPADRFDDLMNETRDVAVRNDQVTATESAAPIRCVRSQQLEDRLGGTAITCHFKLLARRHRLASARGDVNTGHERDEG